MRYYEELSKPGADKEWEQEIENYRKNTGRDPSWMGENINEDEITGYIEPDSIPPSKGAASELKKAQERFAKAITILARDIADGLNRNSVSAKHIGIFRKFAKDLKLDSKTIEKLTIQSMDGLNFYGEDYKTDKERMQMLQKGIDTIFKQSVISDASFLSNAEAFANSGSKTPITLNAATDCCFF